jgi:hypothetical protein
MGTQEKSMVNDSSSINNQEIQIKKILGKCSRWKGYSHYKIYRHDRLADQFDKEPTERKVTTTSATTTENNNNETKGMEQHNEQQKQTSSKISTFCYTIQIIVLG